MNEVQVTVIGTVCSEVRYSRTDTDVPAARFQIRSHPRRYDASSGTWSNGDPSYYSATCWRSLADHVASSMGVGDPVVATGRLRISQWRRGGEKMVSAELDVQAIGHDLRWGTTAYRRGGAASDAAELAELTGVRAAPGADSIAGSVTGSIVGSVTGSVVDADADDAVAAMELRLDGVNQRDAVMAG